MLALNWSIKSNDRFTEFARMPNPDKGDCHVQFIPYS